MTTIGEKEPFPHCSHWKEAGGDHWVTKHRLSCRRETFNSRVKHLVFLTMTVPQHLPHIFIVTMVTQFL